MAEIVNLRMARKARERAVASADADAARARHGRSKAEKMSTRAEVSRIGKILDGAKRDEAPGGPRDSVPGGAKHEKDQD